jgi:hypothetical protein
MVVLAGPGTKHGWWPWDIGFTVIKWGTYVGFVAAACALILVLMLAVPRWRARPGCRSPRSSSRWWRSPRRIIVRNQARGVPPIHDITTDTTDPPALRVGTAYGGAAVAAQQQQAYPDIKPLVVKAPPAEARAERDRRRALAGLGDRLERGGARAHRRGRHDLVVGLQGRHRDPRAPEGTGSRVDIRSVSRVGRSDLGANAKRIREFLAKLG